MATKPGPIRESKDYPYSLRGTEVTKEQRDDGTKALGWVNFRREQIKDVRRKLDEEEQHLAAIERVATASVCQNCGGRGGFNVRDWEGWTGEVNTCHQCNGTGRPKQAVAA